MLAIIATVLILLPGALTASSGAEGGDGGTVAVLFDFGDGRWGWADVPLRKPANAWCATVDAADELGYDREKMHIKAECIAEERLRIARREGLITEEEFKSKRDVWEAEHELDEIVDDIKHELVKNKGSQFDPEVVDVFLEVLKEEGTSRLRSTLSQKIIPFQQSTHDIN